MSVLRFIHLSDIHILPSADDRFMGADTASNLRNVVARIKELHVNPQFVIVSGDLAQYPQTGDPADLAKHADERSYEHLKQLVNEELASLDVPVLIGLGNHDSLSAFSNVMLDETRDDTGKYYYATEVAGVNIIMLDSRVAGVHHGEIGDEQLRWLDKQLSASTAELGSLVVVHHPPTSAMGHRGDDTTGLIVNDHAAFETIIERHQPLGVLSGHTHVFSLSTFGGVLSVTSTGVAFLLDQAMNGTMSMLSGSGFNLCSIRDSKLTAMPILLPTDQHVLRTIDFAAVLATSTH